MAKKRVTQEVEFKLDYDGETYKVIGDYTPSRPAPSANTPEDPGFSDPGESSEFTITAIFLEGEKLGKFRLSVLEEDDIFMEEAHDGAYKAWGAI